MSLNPWFPVPITPSVTRLLGATLPLKPSAESGTITGKARPAANARPVMWRKSRRECRSGTDGCWLMRGAHTVVDWGLALDGILDLVLILTKPRAHPNV